MCFGAFEKIFANIFDVFAKFFLEKYFVHGVGIEGASEYALQSATSFLKFRSNK